MISSVSNISFRQNAQDLINQPGRFTTAPQTAPKADEPVPAASGKKRSKAPVIIGTVAALAVATAVTLGIMASKGKLFTKVANPEKILDKCKNAVTTAGEWIAENSSKAWKWATGLFKKGETAA